MSRKPSLSELLFKGRSNDDIFFFETQSELLAKHGKLIRDTKVSEEETRSIVYNDVNFRKLQQMLRDRHCVTDAWLRENIQHFLKETEQRTHESTTLGRSPSSSSRDQKGDNLLVVGNGVVEFGEGRDEGISVKRNKDVLERS